MKLLYINPPGNLSTMVTPPMSLLYLSGVTRKLCETKILDLKVIEETDFLSIVQNTVKEYNPDIVGITCLFSGDIVNIVRIAESVKNVNPSIVVMTGGMHPTLFAKDILKNCLDIDIVFMGEGEDSTKKVLCAILDNKDFSGIDGVAYRQKDSKVLLSIRALQAQSTSSDYSICCCPQTTYIENIDLIPRPAYELFNMDDYKVDTSRWYNPNNVKINGLALPILTSRSCPNQCNFCSSFHVMGKRFRARSADSVVDEIEYLYNSYDVRYIRIMDDNFTLDKKRAMDICNKIVAKGMKLALECVNGFFINSLDEELISALVSAGLMKTAFPIESGSDYIRNEVIRKHLPRNRIYEVAELFSKYPKVFVKAFIVIGFPEETEQTLQDSVNMLKELPLDDISVAPLAPLPGTRVFEQCKKDNLFLHKYDSETLWNTDELHYLRADAAFFIKPYNLDVQRLEEYYAVFQELNKEKHRIAAANGKGLDGWKLD